MKYTPILASCLMLILIFGCSDDNPLETKSPVPFPNTVGSYWIYEAVDSVRSTIDTFTVTIVDTMTLPGMDRPATLWLGDARNVYLAWGTDSTWIMLDTYEDDKDTARYYFWREGWEPWQKGTMVTPLDIDDEWSFPDGLIPTMTSVVRQTDLTTPAGSFDDAFELEQIYNCGDECGGDHRLWIAEGIGIIKSRRQEWDIFDFPDGPHMIIKMTLIEYYIAE